MSTGPSSIDHPESVDLERHRVRSRSEVLRILRALAGSTQVISAYFNDGHEFIITSLLGLDSKHNKILLDFGPDKKLNRRLVEAGKAVLVATPNKVRVQFDADSIQGVNYQGKPAFLADLPPSLIRIQRREFLRIGIPAGNHLLCRFTAADGTAVTARVIDISVGGLGLIEPENQHPDNWKPGTVIPAIHFELPGEGRIDAAVEIRSRFAADGTDNEEQFHIGCMFVGLFSRQSAAIQRYIRRLELEGRRFLDD